MKMTSTKKKARKLYRRKLYHFTSREAVADIEQHGFKPGEDGVVWFAEHPTCVWGESAGSVLIEIVAVIRDVVPFKTRVVSDEEWDSSTDSFVKSEFVVKMNYYALPPNVANRFPMKIVSDQERHKMII